MPRISFSIFDIHYCPIRVRTVKFNFQRSFSFKHCSTFTLN